ncbi:DUF1661 domain-containing protein [Porphyromonas gingivalis]|nr:DUF1661 domain-containing protein [Porphyromonas gingivalis]WKD53739.1 DUF1661 domain-containing protein [Porphyromonas gingivalis]WKD55787.1 DUF1661 domain-containing protein [Porphyromonas gingivalis]
MAWEVKILRATTEKFSLVNLRKLEPHSGQFPRADALKTAF